LGQVHGLLGLPLEVLQIVVLELRNSCSWPQQTAILDLLSDVGHAGAVRPRDIHDFLRETKESTEAAVTELRLRIQHNAMRASPVHPSLDKDPKVRVEWIRVSKAINSPHAKFPVPQAENPAGTSPSPVKQRPAREEVIALIVTEGEVAGEEGWGEEEAKEGRKWDQSPSAAGWCDRCGKCIEAASTEPIQQERRERARSWALMVWQHTLIEWQRRSLLRVLHGWHLRSGLGVAIAALDKIIKKKKKEIGKAEAAVEEMAAQRKAAKKAQTGEMMTLESRLARDIEVDYEAASGFKTVALKIIANVLAADSDRLLIEAVVGWGSACRLARQ